MPQDIFDKIEAFNRQIIDLPIPSQPKQLSLTRKSHGHDHMLEELNEFWEADNIEDEADALLDLIYVAGGRLIEMGLPAAKMFDEVHRANMQRVRGSNRKRPNSLTFDAVKPEGWTPPNLGQFCDPRFQTTDWIEGENDLDLGQYIGLSRVSDDGPYTPKILVLGYGRHGKDTVSEILRDDLGLSFTSSSMFCAEHVMLPYFQEKFDTFYPDAQTCYEDRHTDDNRSIWYDGITDFNKPDASALGRAIFAEHDVYCGLRNKTEFNAIKNAGLFDWCIWVDRSDHEPPEDKSSCTVEPWMADFVIDNNGDLKQLRFNVNQLFTNLIEEGEF